MTAESVIGRKSTIAYLRAYRKAMLLLVLKKGETIAEKFSRIILNEDMYKEVTIDLTIPKGHVATFEGIPVQSSGLLPYGSIIYIPKILEVEIDIHEKKETVH